jgi:hypothetical protein
MKTATTTELQNDFLIDLVNENPEKEIIVRKNLAGELVVIVKDDQASSDEKYTLTSGSLGSKDTINVSKEKGIFTAKRLTRAHIPTAKYRDKAWLKAQLEQHGTYAKIAEVEGYNEKTLSNWGLRLGIKQHDKNLEKEFLNLYSGSGLKTVEFEAWAKEKGVSVSTLYRWVAGSKGASAKKERRPKAEPAKTAPTPKRPKRKRGKNLRASRTA